MQVTPKKTGWLNFGTKYTHTYSITSTTTSSSASIQFTSSGVSGGYFYTVTSQEGIDSWAVYDDNAILLQ